MSDLLALAERCEAATGPDRELDGDVYEALGGVLTKIRGTTTRRLADRYNGRDVPRYTASLDAAMTLVPDGSVWLRKSPETMSIYTPPTDEKVWAHHIDGKGTTPALALTAAALRARATQ